MEPSWASRKRKKHGKEGRETPGEGEKERERERKYVVLEQLLAFSVKASVVFSSRFNYFGNSVLGW